MQNVDSIERDYVSALTNIFRSIPQDEYFRPVPLGEEYTLTEKKRLVVKPLVLVERRAVSYRDTLRRLDPQTITEAGTKDLSLRRIDNIFKVEANRLTNQDFLAGVDLEISPCLKELEPFRHWGKGEHKSPLRGLGSNGIGPTKLELLEEKIRKFIIDDIECRDGIQAAIARGKAIRPKVDALNAAGDIEDAQALLSDATRWPENYLKLSLSEKYLPDEIKTERAEWLAMHPSTPSVKRERDHALQKLEALSDVLLNQRENRSLNRGIPTGVLTWVEPPNGAAGLDIQHVPLTPGQDWLGNTDPLLSLKQIAHPISAFDLLSRWSGASGEKMGALSERLVRFLKHGALHLFEPQERGARVLYAPSTKGGAAIEIDCAAASLGGWTAELTDVASLSGLFVDMAEVEALEAQYDSLKPTASDNSGQEPEQAAPMARVEAEDTPGAKPTPENMLRMHKDNPKKWTLAALANEYFRNSPVENVNTVKSRLQRYLAKARKA